MDCLEERQVALLIRTYLTALEQRHPGSRGHAERVAAMAEVIARVIGFQGAALRQVRRAGLLHDIGKLGLADAILGKPGRLTDAEYAAIQAHPVYSALFLVGVPALVGALPGILHHHERWDGTGYPLRLAGRAIPLAARILAVVDVFDALRSDRVYRPALPLPQALAIIAEGAGTHFDPAIVQIFLAAVRAAEPPPLVSAA
jgi:HD-GYP domain-containing protein (c-di-GMP phosphodiesterase class II)